MKGKFLCMILILVLLVSIFSAGCSPADQPDGNGGNTSNGVDQGSVEGPIHGGVFKSNY